MVKISSKHQKSTKFVHKLPCVIKLSTNFTTRFFVVRNSGGQAWIIPDCVCCPTGLFIWAKWNEDRSTGLGLGLLWAGKYFSALKSGQHIRCKPTNMCKLGNYQLGPLDADSMNGVRGGIFLRLSPPPTVLFLCLSPLTPSIGSASSGPDR